MIPPPDAAQIRTQLRIWWLLWFAVLLALGGLYFIVRRPGVPLVATANPFPYLIGFVPLFISIVLRWLVLPRDRQPVFALMIFTGGLVLAELGGVLGLMFGGPYREILFVVGLLAIAQFVPFYARGYYEPKSRGFIPNN